MDIDQNNHVDMFNAVDKFGDKNSSLFSAVPKLVTAFATLKTNIANIGTTDQAQSEGSQGYTGNKKTTKNDVLDAAMVLAGAVRAYAVENNDAVLLQQVKISRSRLSKKPGSQFPDACQTIHDAADLNAAALAPFGVAPADITDFQSIINDYKTIQADPRTAIVNKHSQTVKLDNQIHVTSTLLDNTIDHLMLKFKKSNPDKYTAYIGARAIINDGSHITTISGTVTLADTNEHPNNRTVTLAATADDDDFQETTKTDVNGEYEFTSMLPKSYSVTIEPSGGYEGSKQTLTVQAGKHYIVNIALQHS